MNQFDIEKDENIEKFRNKLSVLLHNDATCTMVNGEYTEDGLRYLYSAQAIQELIFERDYYLNKLLEIENTVSNALHG